MLQTPVLKQKQAGIILITLGIFLFAFIVTFLYFNVIRIPGFPELLPSQETIGFVEFPTALEDAFSQKLNETLGVDWNKDVLPWAGEKSALAILKDPFLLIQIRSLEQSFSFLRNFKNPSKEIHESKLSGITAFSTPQIHFAFLSDVLVIAPSEKSLEIFLAHQSSFNQHLSSNSDFIRIRQNLGGPFFVYVKPRELHSGVYSLLSQTVPSMPFFTQAFPALGISAEKQNNAWGGKSYAVLEKNLPSEPSFAYRAALLPLLPADIDMLISGQNLSSQLKKIDTLVPADTPLPKLAHLMKIFAQTYLPDTNFEKDIAPLITREFALTAKGNNVLFVTEIADQILAAKIDALRSSFQKISGRFTPRAREIVLPDGTKAAELIPDSSKVKSFEEMFGGVEIKGFLFGKNGAVYDAFTQGKWFISNDFETLKKALQLTKETGPSFRESALYKDSLRPILKNPELAGVAVLPPGKFPGGIFSFSKRTLQDHMETNFIFVIR